MISSIASFLGPTQLSITYSTASDGKLSMGLQTRLDQRMCYSQWLLGFVCSYTDMIHWDWPITHIPQSHICNVIKSTHSHKSAHPLRFGPISCIGSKFNRMSAHPGASFMWSLRTTASSTMHIWSKKLCVILQQMLLQGIFHIDRHSKCNAHHKLHHAHSDIVLFRVLCHQDSTSKLLVVPLYITVCPIVCFKGIELL